MALLTCPECGHKVSEFATACPECGCPVSKMISSDSQKKVNLKGFTIRNGTLVKYKGKDSNVIIPDSVTSIRVDAFLDCESIESIEIPSSVTIIGKIPSSIIYMGEGVFSYCDNLQRIKVAKDNPKYYSENNCIIEKESKTLIAGCNASTIPEGVKAIGKSAFSGCTLMQSIKIPSGVKSIGECAFRDCESLKSVTIPSSVEKIEHSAFKYRDTLSNIKSILTLII